jgi:hypothetical protein
MLILRRRRRGWSLVLSRRVETSLDLSLSRLLYDDVEVLSQSGVFRPDIKGSFSLGGNIWYLRGSVC